MNCSQCHHVHYRPPQTKDFQRSFPIIRISHRTQTRWDYRNLHSEAVQLSPMSNRRKFKYLNRERNGTHSALQAHPTNLKWYSLKSNLGIGPRQLLYLSKPVSITPNLNRLAFEYVGHTVHQHNSRRTTTALFLSVAALALLAYRNIDY